MCLNVQCCVFSLVITKIPRKISTVKSYLFKIAFYCRWKGFSQFKSFDHLGKFLEIVMGWWLDDNVATMTKIMMIGEHDEKLKANQANDEIKRNNMKMERNKKRKKRRRRNMMIIVIIVEMCECFFLGMHNKICHIHAMWVCMYIYCIFINIYILIYTPLYLCVYNFLYS